MSQHQADIMRKLGHMITDCLRCGGYKSARKNAELLGGQMVVTCSQCRKAWIEGDEHVVEMGPEVMTRLIARARTLAFDGRHKWFVEDDNVILWETLI